MQPEIHIGPLELKTFGICFALGFLVSGLLINRRLRELGRPADWTYEFVFAALIGGLVGSRVDFLIQNWDKVSDDVLGNVFSGAGLVWFGGFVGGALGVILWARWRRWLGWELFDTAAVPLAVGYAIGRVGCQLSGDGDYGTKSDLPWAMAYPDGTVPTTDEVHPTPVYETLAMGVAGLVLWQAARPRGARGPVRALPGDRGDRALPCRVHPPQRGRGRGPHPAAAHRPCNGRARRRDPGHAARRAPRGDGLSALPRAAAAQRASATVAPAALCAWKETPMPTIPATTATAAPPSIARAGVRACCITASGGPTSTASTSSAPSPWTATATAAAISTSRTSRISDGRRPAAAAPGASKATADSGRWSAGQRGAAEREQRRRGHQVAVGHTERVAEQQLLEPLGRVGRERQQRTEADEAGHRHGRARVRADARVAGGEGDQHGGHERAAGGAEQERRPGKRREHQTREQPVRERLGAVGQALGHHPEAERAAEAADQRDLEQRPPVDAGAERSSRKSSTSTSVPCSCSWCWIVTARVGPESSSTISSRP